MLSISLVKELLKNTTVVSAPLHDENCEFEIWPMEKLEEWNEGYEVAENLPGYVAIGSDGGLEMLTVELSTGIVYAIPFIPMEKQAGIKVSDSLELLLGRHRENKEEI